VIGQALAGVGADGLVWIQLSNLSENIALLLVDGVAWNNITIPIKPAPFIFIWHHKTSLSKFIFPTVYKHG
jgi:hypothetical protein